MIVLSVLITVFTLSMQIKKRNQTIFNEYILEANDGDYTNFLKVQTNAYLHIKEIPLETYQISLYYTDKLIVFVRPLKEVNFAKSQQEDDKTQLTLIGEATYNSKDQKNYGDFPVSYGLTKMGFYYYQADVKQGNYELKLTDYDGVIIYDEIEFINTTGEYQKGFSAKEIELKLKEDETYLRAVYITFGICIALSLLGGVILFKKKNKNR